ncbi:MAG TPA: 2-oxoglutarate dehydrogenase complex dihydrolipoyllysine-residue succinyltransferase [Steroidobacteraceae bacterium]|nr:2-oxoglutarate dehydrogenase complex dihydrolipoyllysine-residue succinyltransferase [Steroidobacteraceae bacterium]
MTTEIKVPQLPESITDATLVAWHKRAGDAVRRDENLADLETDKVVLEVPAPANGVLRELKVQTGAVVSAGQLLALIEESAQAVAMPAAAKAAPPAEELKATGTEGAREKEKLSPSVRRLIEENRLDAAAIPASGRDGRLTKSDVVDFLGRKEAAAPAAAPSTAAAAPAEALRAPTPATALTPRGERGEHRVPMTRLRQRIAQRLIEAQSTQALLTSFNEVDLTAVQELRARHKDRFEKEHGVKLGFMSFFVKACIEALKRFPVVNASVDGNDILYHEFYDIGVAVSTERGLVVPIVRDADIKGFAAIEKEIGEYARKARSGGLAIEDLTGGTFTITNGGVFGSLMSTPIVNAPQSAILGMHKIQERPMVVAGQIAIRPMMYIAITYDHRIIDGREAVQFLVTVKECLEDPGRMLLGI